jgi:hypothetical protein
MCTIRNIPMHSFRNLARTILLTTITWNLVVVARGDETPLALRDIARLRQQRVPLDKIVDKAAEQGIAFAVTPGVEKQLARMGFSPEQIDTIKQSAVPRGKADEEKPGNKKAGKEKADKAEKPAAIVPGQGLSLRENERDRILDQVTRITKLSGANVQPVETKHLTLWAARGDQATFLPDLRKIESYLEGKCKEPLRSGLDRRAAHLILLRTRYDYEKWVKAMFEVMPDAFKTPDAPGGRVDMKAAILKWSGYYSHHFVVLCMEGQETPWLYHLVAAGAGFMNFVQQIEPQRQDPLSTGFANGAEVLVTGAPQLMLFSNSYHNEDRDLGNDPRAWLHLVQTRMRAKQESGVRGLLTMDTTNMLLPQYAEAWTLVGVLAKQPEKFGKLLVALRDEKDPLKAIEQVYGWDEKKLETEWHKDVLGQR